MRRPKLSEHQKRFLMIALVREKRMRRQHRLSAEVKSTATKKDRDTALLLSRFGLLTVSHSDWKIIVEYWLSPAGELLAQALFDLKTRKIAASRA